MSNEYDSISTVKEKKIFEEPKEAEDSFEGRKKERETDFSSFAVSGSSSDSSSDAEYRDFEGDRFQGTGSFLKQNIKFVLLFIVILIWFSGVTIAKHTGAVSRGIGFLLSLIPILIFLIAYAVIKNRNSW